MLKYLMEKEVNMKKTKLIFRTLIITSFIFIISGVLLTIKYFLEHKEQIELKSKLDQAIKIYNFEMVDENSNKRISRTDKPTVYLGSAGDMMLSCICIAITAPIKSDMTSTIGIEFTPNL